MATDQELDAAGILPEAPDSMARPNTLPRGQDEASQLLIPIEDIFHRLRVEAEWLRRTMYSTLAHAGNGPGARRYSRTRLGTDAARLRGAFNLVTELIRDRLPGSGLPEELRNEIYGKLIEAEYVADGRNPDGTKRKVG